MLSINLFLSIIGGTYALNTFQMKSKTIFFRNLLAISFFAGEKTLLKFVVKTSPLWV